MTGGHGTSFTLVSLALRVEKQRPRRMLDTRPGSADMKRPVSYVMRQIRPWGVEGNIRLGIKGDASRITNLRSYIICVCVVI